MAEVAFDATETMLSGFEADTRARTYWASSA